jgi:dipeptidase E
MRIYLTSTFANVVQNFIKDFSLTPTTIKVAFVENASDPYPEHPWTQKDKDSLINNAFQVKEIDIRNIQSSELRNQINDADVIFIAGGNTAYLFQIAQQSGLYEIIRELKDSDKIFVGSSAGSILAGPSVEPIYESDKKELAELGHDINLTNLDGIGLVDFIVLPHTNKESYKKEFEEHVIPNFGDGFKFKMLTDDEALIINT